MVSRYSSIIVEVRAKRNGVGNVMVAGYLSGTCPYLYVSSDHLQYAAPMKDASDRR